VGNRFPPLPLSLFPPNPKKTLPGRVDNFSSSACKLTRRGDAFLLKHFRGKRGRRDGTICKSPAKEGSVLQLGIDLQLLPWKDLVYDWRRSKLTYSACITSEKYEEPGNNHRHLPF